MTKSSLYRPCVGIALFNKDNHVFVGERIDTPGAWQMPQGGIDPGENIKRAAIRELREETGTDKAEIIRVADDVPIRYDFPPDLQQRLWNGKFAGQEQIWVAARFTGSDADIDLHSFNPPEFNAWQWVSLGQTIDFIVPFKLELYKKVIELFSDIP